VEEGAVGASPDLIDDIGFQVNEEGTGNVFAGASLREKGGEARVAVGRRALNETTVGAKAVLDGVEFPTRVSDLNTSLTDVDGDNFTHRRLRVERR